MEIPEYLTKKGAVQFIVDRVEKPQDEDKRAWRNKINLRLTRDKTITQEKGKYRSELIIVHARKCYGFEPFKGYPISHVATGALSGGVSIVMASGFAYSTPGNLEECQTLIGKLHKENHQLIDEIKKRDGEIERLTPLADKYLTNCTTNKKNASKPRQL